MLLPGAPLAVKLAPHSNTPSALMRAHNEAKLGMQVRAHSMGIGKLVAKLGTNMSAVEVLVGICC